MRTSWIVSLGVALVLVAAGCRGRSGGTAACTPGEVVAIGCTSSLGTRCTGDPTLTICDVSVVADPELCTRERAPSTLGYSDDSDGTCPMVTVTCPASGSVSINPNPLGSTSGLGWSCAYAVDRRGIPVTSSIETCTAGESVMVGCTGTLGATCAGDPTLTVCDASMVASADACLRTGTYLAYNDDSSGYCPLVTATCPASGRIAVHAAPFGSSAFTCDYAVSRSGIGP